MRKAGSRARARTPPPASMGPQLDSCGRWVLRFYDLFTCQLQWGRNLIVAEGLGSVICHSRISLLQWGRNLIVAEGRVNDHPPPAAEALQWGRNLIVAEGPVPHDGEARVPASMGPQLDSCGRTGGLYNQAGRYRLQWGRNLIVAEGYAPAPLGARVPGASMGPQLDSCGRPWAGRTGRTATRFNGAAT